MLPPFFIQNRTLGNICLNKVFLKFALKSFSHASPTPQTFHHVLHISPCKYE